MEINDYTIIVRSVGERTTDKCVEYVKKVFDTNDVTIVSGVTPHQEMVKKCFSIGIESGRKWTVCIDADIFLEKDKFKEFVDNIDYLDKKDEKLFSISPCFFDYFFNCSRHVGLHIYKTDLLPQAMEMIMYNTLRPETTVKRKMSENGYSSYLMDITVGIHDFFDSYESILMKGLLHLKKHANRDELLKEWKHRSKDEEDFQWLCKAAEIETLYSNEDFKVDALWVREIIKKHYPNIPVKPELHNKEIDEALEKYSKICMVQKVSSNSKESLIAKIRNKIRVLRKSFL